MAIRRDLIAIYQQRTSLVGNQNFQRASIVEICQRHSSAVVLIRRAHELRHFLN